MFHSDWTHRTVVSPLADNSNELILFWWRTDTNYQLSEPPQGILACGKPCIRVIIFGVNSTTRIRNDYKTNSPPITNETTAYTSRIKTKNQQNVYLPFNRPCSKRKRDVRPTLTRFRNDTRETILAVRYRWCSGTLLISLSRYHGCVRGGPRLSLIFNRGGGTE